METFTMSRKEAPRAGLVKAGLAGQITNAQGASALGLIARHFQRLKAQVRAEGVAGLVPRGRGKEEVQIGRGAPPDPAGRGRGASEAAVVGGDERGEEGVG